MRRVVPLYVVWAVAVILTGRTHAWAGPLQTDPKTAAGHYQAGMAHLQAGRANEALTEFRLALRLDPDNVPFLIQMADLLSSHQRFFLAYRVLEHAVSLVPEAADVHALLGRCLFRMKKRKEARESFERALALSPDLAEPHFMLAAIESERGRLKDARRHIERYLQLARGAELVKGLQVLAGVAFGMKDYDGALAAYAELRKADPAQAGIELEVARTLLAAGRLAEAKQAYRSLLEKDSTDQRALLGLFNAGYHSGAYEEAVEAMQLLARQEPWACEPLLNLVRVYRVLDQFRQARAQAERCLRIIPEHPTAHLMIGLIWYRQGELGRAKAELEHAVRSNANLVEALYWLGTVELRLDETGSALAHLERAVSIDRDHKGVRHILAQVYTRKKRLADAKAQLAEFERIRRQEEWTPTPGEAEHGDTSSTEARAGMDTAHLDDWIGFASYLLKAEKPRDALALLEKARDREKENPELLRLTAIAHTETGDIDAALASYADTERLGPTARLFLGRGTVYYRLGEDEAAFADLRRALSMGLAPPEAARARLLLASLLNKKKRYEDAEVELRQAVELDPYNVSARGVLASTLLRLGRPEEAATESLRVLERNPGDSSGHLMLAWARIEQEQFTAASGLIQRAAAIQGEAGLVLLTRGKLAAVQGLGKVAIDYLTRATEVDPSQVDAFYLLGVQLSGEGRFSEAVLALEKATILDPGHGESWLEMGKIFMKQEGPEAAIGYLRKAVAAAPDNAEAHYQLAVGLAQTNKFAEAEQVARQAQELGHPAAQALLQSLLGVPRR